MKQKLDLLLLKINSKRVLIKVNIIKKSLLKILQQVRQAYSRDINNADINRKYPANVLLDIQGDLRFPEIDFDITVEDYPKNAVVGGISMETQVAAFRNKIATDEQELKRQVFSLSGGKGRSTNRTRHLRYSRPV